MCAISDEIISIWFGKIESEPKMEFKTTVTSEISKAEIKTVTSVANAIKKEGGDRLGYLFESFKKDGKFVATDGHRMLRTVINIGEIDKERTGFDDTKIIDPYADCEETMEVPFDVKELKEQIKLAKEDYMAEHSKKAKRVLYKFENGLTVDAKYLLQGMKATGSREFIYTGFKSLIIFKSKTTEYALLPCNPNAKLESNRFHVVI